jgi:hypothetical protein
MNLYEKGNQSLTNHFLSPLPIARSISSGDNNKFKYKIV